MSAKIVSVAHRKGGIGKTSTTLHLATALATIKKKRVLVLDTDSQQSAFKYRAFEDDSIYEKQIAPPYPIERVQPKFLFDEIRHRREDFDVIFIDVPRLTEGTEDSQLSTAITYCDLVLLPIVAGDLEGLSTIEFVKMIKEIAAYKEDKGFTFSYYGFLNKKSRRKENDQVTDFMKNLGVPMFEHALSDVKALSKPYTFESVLGSAEGKRRFEPFFKEFIKKANL